MSASPTATGPEYDAAALVLPAYRSILLAADASDHSDRGAHEAAALASLWEAELSGVHVYAARMHDLRFRQMEGGLPETFRQEEALEHQREVHDDLITRGLATITDAYLDQVQSLCARRQLRYRRVALEGKNYRELVTEANSGRYDLLVLGALGLGAVAGTRLGTVCTRVLRRSAIDTLVIKDPQRGLDSGPLVAAVDGSEQGYGALLAALALAKAWRVPLHVVAAYDPYYHYVAFKRIAGVLSEEASRVFNFKEQERLHEEIIDSGLAKIYQGHLHVAANLAEQAGVAIHTRLLDGKPFEAIGRQVAELGASALFLGKLGVHADAELDIGGNAEHLAREVGCAVWLSQRRYRPQTELLAEVTTSWSHEAEAAMLKVPAFARGMARTAVLRYTQEHGHTVVTASIVQAATASLCPAGHRVPAGAPSEDGSGADAPVRWETAAAAALAGVADPAVRNNLRRRIEKKARAAGAAVVTAAHAQALVGGAAPPGPAPCPFGAAADAPSAPAPALPWTAPALRRLERIPEGFMRELTRQRVEHFARGRGQTEIDEAAVEAKYAIWARGSERQHCTLPWDEEASAVLGQIPELVRGMVALEVERCAAAAGRDRVGLETFRSAVDAWARKQAFHSDVAPGLYRDPEAAAGRCPRQR